jgi:hypothetical protein
LAFAILPGTDFLPPSPPAEKATARQDQAGQTSTGGLATFYFDLFNSISASRRASGGNTIEGRARLLDALGPLAFSALFSAPFGVRFRTSFSTRSKNARMFAAVLVGLRAACGGFLDNCGGSTLLNG